MPASSRRVLGLDTAAVMPFTVVGSAKPARTKIVMSEQPMNSSGRREPLQTTNAGSTPARAHHSEEAEALHGE